MPSTLGDKVTLLPKFSFVIAKTLLSVLTSPFRGDDGAPTVGEHVTNTAVRTMLTNFTTGQLQ